MKEFAEIIRRDAHLHRAELLVERRLLLRHLFIHFHRDRVAERLVELLLLFGSF